MKNIVTVWAPLVMVWHGSLRFAGQLPQRARVMMTPTHVRLSVVRRPTIVARWTMSADDDTVLTQTAMTYSLQAAREFHSVVQCI